MQIVVEAHYPVAPGSTIDSICGYKIYSSIKSKFPWLKSDYALINPPKGMKHGNKFMKTHENSILKLRVGADKFNDLYRLANKRLSVGQSEIVLKIPTIFPIQPKSTLESRLVLIHLRSENPKKVLPEDFLMAVERQLAHLNIKGKASLIIDQQGSLHRRVLKIKGSTLAGYGVKVTSLSDEDSITLQTYGIGGHKKMGGGFFC